MAVTLALCLCASVSACGDKEAASSEPADSAPQDSAPEETVQITEISLEQIEDYTSSLWKTDISDADGSISDKLGISTEKKELKDSGDNDDAGFNQVFSQTYIYDLTDSPTEVMGIPCKEVSIYASYDKDEKDSEKQVESLTFIFEDSTEENYSKLSDEMVAAYGEGTEGKSFISSFVYWTPSGKDMFVSLYPPSDDSSVLATELMLKFEYAAD